MNTTFHSRLTVRRVLSAAALVFTIIQLSQASKNDTAKTVFFDNLFSNISFLPEYRFDADLKYFSFQKNDYFREHYYLENTVNLGFTLFSFWKNVHWTGEFYFINSMGQSPGNIVFDPIDIGYGLLLAFEYHHPSVILQTGLAHNCAHQIDRQELRTVYYNNPVIAAGSVNFRQFDYWDNLAQNESWDFNDRFSWYCRLGYYLREFFGLASPGKLNGMNPYVFDLHGELRYAFFGSRGWILDIKNSLMAGYHTDVDENPAGNGIGWSSYFSLEAMTRRSAKGSLLFATFGFDGLPLYPSMDGSAYLPRFSYDRMLQVGLKFFM